MPTKHMKLTLTFVLVAATAGLSTALAAAPSGPEPVEIAQDNGVLKALLFRPEGT